MKTDRRKKARPVKYAEPPKNLVDAFAEMSDADQPDRRKADDARAERERCLDILGRMADAARKVLGTGTNYELALVEAARAIRETGENTDG